MNYYNHNLKVVKAHSPELWEALPVIKDTGKFSQDRSKRLVMYDGAPIKMAPAQGFELNKNTKIAIVIGLGSGEALESLVSQAKAQGSALIVIEPHLELFKNLMYIRDLKALFTNSKMFLLLGLPPNRVFSRFLELFNRMEYCDYVSTIQVFKSPGLELIAPGYAVECEKAAMQARYNIYDSFGFEADSWSGIQIVFENLKDTIKAAPVTNLANLAPNIPAFILSAGPSLTESLPKIKELQKKGVVIAADGAYGQCLRSGVEPDLVASIERGLSSKPLFDDAPEFEDITLVRFPFVKRQVFDKFKGRRMVAYRNYEYFRYFYPHKGRIQCGVSVAHFCFRLAQLMQCRPIVLIGQDLAFHPESFSSHADGVPHKQEWTAEKLIHDKGAMWVDGNTYDKVLTIQQWARFIHDFQILLDEYPVQVINTSRLGAVIPGVPYKPLDDTLNELPDLANLDFRSALKEAGKPDTTPNAIPEMRKRMVRWLEFCDKILEKKDPIEKLLNKKDISLGELAVLEDLQDTLRSTPIFTAFILNIMGGEHIKLKNQRTALGDEITEENKKEVLTILFTWYMVVYRNVERLKDLIQDTMETL